MRKLIPITICLLLAACSLPLPTNPTDDINNQAATLVAMTLNPQVTPTQESQENMPLPTPTRSPDNGPTATITPTFSVPMLKVDDPTNCRSGPGENFEVVTVFQSGAEAEIVGRTQQNDWWQINNPFATGTCWISAAVATVSGSSSTVDVMTPPPPATAKLPSPPSIASWDFTCTYENGGPTVNFNLKWSDRAADETGYRIYRNDELVTELPPNSSSFSESVAVKENQQMTYRLEVYNGAGATSASPINFSCQ